MNQDVDPYSELADAVVAQAVEDYQKELAKLELDPKNGPAALEVRRLEKFFHSAWYSMLTRLDPDALMAGARILAKKEAREKRLRLGQMRVRKCMETVGEILGALEEQDELSEEQKKRLKDLCLEAVDLTEKMPQMKADAETYEEQAVRRVGLGKQV